MAESELNQFLNFDGQGTYDSSGEFTLSPSEALEKLAPYQLPEQGLWVAKMVQASVRYGASLIDFRLGRHSIELRCYDGAFPSAQEILADVYRGEIPSQPSRRHLLSGLRAILGEKPTAIGWIDQQGHTIIVEEGTVKEVRRRPLSGELSFYLKVELRPLSRPALFRQTTAERHILRDRCALCPVPIVCDGRLISGRTAFPPGFLGNSKCLASYLTAPGNRPGLRVAAHGIALEEVILNPKQPSRSLPDEPWTTLECGMLVALRHGGEPYSEAYWVKDGVLLNPTPLLFRHSWLSLQVFMPGDHQRVDLSEFSVRKAPLDAESIFHGLDAIMAVLWGRPKLVTASQPTSVVTGDDLRSSGSFLSHFGGGPGAGRGPALILGSIAAAGYLALRATANIVSSKDSEEALNSLGSAVDKFKFRQREEEERRSSRVPRQ